MELQPFRDEDTETLAAWLVDERLLADTAPDWMHPITADDIRKAYGQEMSDRDLLCAVSDGRIVGHLGIRYGFGTGHLFHVIVDPGLKGRGFGTSMVRAAVAHAFSKPDVHRLALSVFDDNVAAIACYLRAGFLIEGRHRQTFRRGDYCADTYSMALLRSEWNDGCRGLGSRPNTKGPRRELP